MTHRSSKPRRVVGVMIDGDTLRGVEVRRTWRDLEAIAAAEVVLDREARAEGSTLDVDAISEGLRSLWEVGNFKSSEVAFGIDGRHATIRPMTVPAAAGNDIADYVRYQLAEYLSYELDEAVTDHQVVAAGDLDSGTAAEVLAVGVSLSLLESIAASVEAAGLELVAVDVAATALAASIDPASPDDEGDAVVSVDGSRTTVVLRSAGRPRMVRVLAAGGGDHSAKLADELDSMIARVEGHQLGSESPAPVEAAQDRRFAEAAEAVAAAINYDLREHTGTGVAHVILTGAYGRFPSLHKLMAASSGSPVTQAISPSWWPHAAESDLDDFDHFVEPAGLAYAAIHGGLNRFDLMPPSLVETRQNRRELAIGSALAAGVLVLGAVAVQPSRDSVSRSRSEVESIESAVEQLADRVQSMSLVGELDTVRSNQTQSIEVALQDDIWWARVLDEIASATSEDTFLTSITMARPTGSNDDVASDITGVSSDQASVGRWLDAMADLEAFDDVWLVQSSATVLGEDEVSVVSFLAKARLTSEARSPRAVSGADWYATDNSGQVLEDES